MLLKEGSDQFWESIGGALIMLAENTQFNMTDEQGDVFEAPHNQAFRDFARQAREGLEKMRDARSMPLQSDSTLGGYAQDLVRLIPQLAGQIGATALTGPVGGGAMMGAQVAGGQYLELTENGNAKGRLRCRVACQRFDSGSARTAWSRQTDGDIQGIRLETDRKAHGRSHSYGTRHGVSAKLS